MKVYILKQDYNHHGNTITNEILAVYDSQRKARKGLLEEYLTTIRNLAYEQHDLMEKSGEKVELNLSDIIQMENMYYDNHGFSFPVDTIRLHNDTPNSDLSEDYIYLWIEEYELL